MESKINFLTINNSKYSFNRCQSALIIKKPIIKENFNQSNINKNNNIFLKSIKIRKAKNSKIQYSPYKTKILLEKTPDRINNNKINHINKSTKRKFNSASILNKNIHNIRKCGNVSLNNYLFRDKKLFQEKNKSYKRNNVKSYSVIINQNNKDKSININLSNNNFLINRTNLKQRKKTDIISYSYKRLQNKVRLFYSISREVLNKESKKNKYLLIASRNLFNLKFDNEYLRKMSNSFYFGNYDSNKDSKNYFCIIDNNNYNQNYLENKKKIPCFKNKLLARFTRNKELKGNVFVTVSVKEENEKENSKRREIQKNDIKNDIVRNEENNNRIYVYHV